MNKNISTIFKRELTGYFETPVAYVFIVVFLMLSGIFTFYVGQFYNSGQASLYSFFTFHSWLYLFLVPAVSMRLWSEERKSGTIELLMTLPISSCEAVLGKFLAAWSFVIIALFFTFPIWLTVNYLGSPDNGVILMSYIGSILMAGAFLAIGACISALTNSQVVSFVISVTICFLLTVSGFPMVLDFFKVAGFPQVIVDTVSALSMMTNYEEVLKGVISLKNIIYFASMVAFWLAMNVIAIENKRA